MQNQTRFAIITDAHLGKNNLRHGNGTFGAKARHILNQFCREMNTRFKPDFVVSLGDNINDENHANDMKNMYKYASHLINLNTPVYHCIGNHDVKNLVNAEIKTLLKTKRCYYTFDAKHIQGIVLYSFAGKKPTLHKPVLILPNQINWLKTTLSKSKKPVVIFNHYPLDEHDLRTNPYANFFLANPNRATVNNRRAVRKVIATSKKVIGVFTGHLHWTKKNTIQGVPYYSVPSLTEKGSSAWTEVTVQGKKITVMSRPT